MNINGRKLLRSGALVAIDLGFMGPNYSISTACATANYAFVAAANHIRSGEADVMLTGGCEAPIIPVGLGGFVACRSVMSSTPCPAVLAADPDGSIHGLYSPCSAQ